MNNNIINNIKIAFDHILEKPARSLFIISSICFGVATLTIVIITIESICLSLQNELNQKYGTDTLQLVPEHGKKISAETAEKIESVDGVDFVQRLIIDTHKPYRAMVDGISYFVPVTAVEMKDGAIFSGMKHESMLKIESDGDYEKCAFLSMETKGTLFGQREALGKELVIVNGGSRLPLIVCGITSWEQSPYKDILIIPMDAYRKLSAESYASGSDILFVKISKNLSIDRTAAKITDEVLKDTPVWIDIHRPEDIMTEIIKPMNNIRISGILFSTALMISVSIGILCIMYVSVSERKIEIGIHRAVGATQRDIFFQYMFEAVAYSLTGCFTGELTGILVSQSFVINILTDVDPSIPIAPMITIFIVTFMSTLSFGIWPAAKSARMEPSSCIRDI